jgi:hypothetical protein
MRQDTKYDDSRIWQVMGIGLDLDRLLPRKVTAGWLTHGWARAHTCRRRTGKADAAIRLLSGQRHTCPLFVLTSIIGPAELTPLWGSQQLQHTDET